MARAVICVLLIGLAGACSSRPPELPAIQIPPPPTVTKATFEPLYRAGKSVQGATASGVTYTKFGELLQALSTEIGIVKDHPLNAADRRLLALYEEAFGHYQVSSTLWQLKFESSSKVWNGEIPVVLNGKAVNGLYDVAGAYDIPLTDHTMPYTGTKYATVPGDAPQRVWAKADEVLNSASRMYYAGEASNSINGSKQ